MVKKADSGQSLHGSFGYYDPDSCSLKTSQVSLFGGSTESLETLPNSGSMRSGRLYERPTLERPISGGASSSSPHETPYPTPSATPYGSSGNGTGNNVESRGRPSLDSLAARWPTPLGVDSGRGHHNRPNHHRRGDQLRDLATTWPTPVRADDGRGSDTYARGNLTLTGAMRLWPTATRQDSAASGSKGYSTGSGRSAGTTLTDAMREHAGLPARRTPKVGDDGMVLCPEFVEALMGIPVGWTLVPDEAGLGPSGTV